MNPRPWVSEASTLPLHHRNRFDIGYSDHVFFFVWTTQLLGEKKEAALLENSGKQCPCDAVLYP